MAARPYRLVIFDFDGTLADSKAVIAEATNCALRDCGFPELKPGEITRLVGLPLEYSLREFLGEQATEENVERLFERYRRHWRRLEPGRIHLFPGVRELLDTLLAEKVEMAIATSKSLKGLERMFDVLDLRAYFGFWLTNDRVANGKPHPEMVRRALEHFAVEADDAIMAGDTIFDIEMGQAAGVDTCAVTYGSHPAEELEKMSPTYLVHSAEEMRAALLGEAKPEPARLPQAGRPG